MKRFLAFILLSTIIMCTLSAQAIAESSVSTNEVINYDVELDLNTGASSSDLVSSSFNKDGNLELTYKGETPISIAISGTLNGTLIVKSENSDYTLVLNNANITGNTLPAIQLKSTTQATLYLADGSVNTIADSSANSKKGAITTSGDVIIDGNGTLNLSVYKKHGLKLDGGLTINNGNVNIVGDENAEGNMISADLFFVMNGGNLDINAKGNVHATESKGIKVNGIEGTGTGLGYVEINDGNINIVSVGKAITAGWKLEEDAETEQTDDDPIPNVYINGANISIITTGTPYEYSDEESLSPEGIEAKDNLYINGGYIYIVSTDDSLNAGKGIYVNGGYTYARSTDNDSFDSNGIIQINGGTLITMSSSWEQAFDCDNDKYFTYTGGTYVGAGNGNNMPKGESTSAYSIAYGNQTFYAGDQIAVLDKDGNVVTGFVVPYEVPSLTSIVFGSPLFEKDNSYTIALGAYKEQPADSLVEAGATFTARTEVVTIDLTDYTVSEGYIGMNIDTNFGGGFGGFGGGMGGFDKRGDFGGFDGNFDPNNRGVNRPDNMPQNMQFNGQSATLPKGVTLPADMNADTAMQLINYLMQNYTNIGNM